MASGYKDSTTPTDIRDLWETPDYAFMPLDAEFDFGLDAAASVKNAKVPQFLTERDDALSVSWDDYLLPFARRTVWVNPPYSNIDPWMVKAEQEARESAITTVLLVPHTPDAGWWPTRASEVRVVTGVRREGKRNISGRIQFVRSDTGKPAGNQNKGSCYVIFAPFTLGNMTTKYVPITDLLETTERLKADKGVSNA